MKNTSIRTKILTGVVIVNLLGAIVLVIYLHGSYAQALDATAEDVTREASAAWAQLAHTADGQALDPLADPETTADVLQSMTDITETEYGLLLDKSTTDADAYADARETLGLPSNWDEGNTYAMIVTTDEQAAARMAFEVTPDAVPEIGKLVGIENGACWSWCHNTLRGEGDYWGVKWSNDGTSQTHGVFPIAGEDGTPIGVIYAVEDVSQQADGANSTMLRTLVVIGLTLLVSTILIGGMIDRLVFRRLARTVASVKDLSVRVAGGDFDAQFVPDGTHDEIGEFEAFFAQFMDLISSTLKSLVKDPKQ